MNSPEAPERTPLSSLNPGSPEGDSRNIVPTSSLFQVRKDKSEIIRAIRLISAPEVKGFVSMT
jgi:hypothetical protein